MEQILVWQGEEAAVSGHQEAGGHHHGLGGVVADGEGFGEAPHQHGLNVFDHHEAAGFYGGKEYGVYNSIRVVW